MEAGAWILPLKSFTVMKEGRDNLQRAQNPGGDFVCFFKDVKTHISRLWRREEEVKIMEERE